MNGLFSFPSAKFIRMLGFGIQPLKKRQRWDLMSKLADKGGCEIEDEQLNKESQIRSPSGNPTFPQIPD